MFRSNLYYNRWYQRGYLGAGIGYPYYGGPAYAPYFYPYVVYPGYGYYGYPYLM